MVYLNIVVVGGGIGGCAAGIFLAQDGHQVTILEKQSQSYEAEGTGGIALFHNSLCLWRQRGLLDRILAVAESGNSSKNISYRGDVIGVMPSPERHAFVHRGDFLRVLRTLAIEHGATIRYGVTVNSISDDPSYPKVRLVGGEQIEADLIIGADGINSFIRRQLHPSITPTLINSVVLLVDVPKKAMLEHKGTAELWSDAPVHHFFGPRRDIVSWSMKGHDPPVYQLQFCDHAYGQTQWYGTDTPDAPFISIIHDLTGFKERFKDFGPRIRYMLDSVQSYTRWKIAQVPAIPSWSSPGGGFVLVGDSAHAVPPFAGQGANMSVEDSACLAALLRFLKSKGDVHQALEVYDQIRMPRLAGLRELIEMNIEIFGADDGSQVQKDRDSRFKPQNSQDRNASETDWRKFGTKAAWKWAVGYDAIAETEKAWKGFTKHNTDNHKL